MTFDQLMLLTSAQLVRLINGIVAKQIVVVGTMVHQTSCRISNLPSRRDDLVCTVFNLETQSFANNPVFFTVSTGMLAEGVDIYVPMIDSDRRLLKAAARSLIPWELHLLEGEHTDPANLTFQFFGTSGVDRLKLQMTAIYLLYEFIQDVQL